MRCTSPRTVGFKSDGKTLSWSPKNYSKEFATFPLPCGKCIACRLEYARQWAVRCIHEAQMHEKNSFITLTYSDEHLKSPKLIYSDFQNFMKRLRKTQNAPVGVFVTGEYGDKTKRPHWHAIIFNWYPADAIPFRITDRGDRVYTSETLSRLWPYGFAELASVTFESAGYCARYAAKKLVHGRDDTNEFTPISRKSCKHAIGKKFLEKYWKNIFDHGAVFIQKSDGEIVETSIPRYYEKWLQKNQPEAWKDYVTQKKQQRIQFAQEANEKEKQKEIADNDARRIRAGLSYVPTITRTETRYRILKEKFRKLQKHLKL